MFGWARRGEEGSARDDRAKAEDVSFLVGPGPGSAPRSIVDVEG